MNTQPIEKKIISDGSMLQVHSMFQTIQGEGPLAGEPAIFIRLAGCNLQCPSCDTIYTTGRTEMTVPAMLDAVSELMERKNSEITTIVITGGEPFRQNIGPLCQTLVNNNFTVQVETNGTLPPPANFPDEVMIVCSPKTGKINPILEPMIDALKYVVKAGDISDEDGLPMHALGHPCVSTGVARTQFTGLIPIYVQPQDDKDEVLNRQNMATAVNSVLDHGHILCIQMHKYAAIE